MGGAVLILAVVLAAPFSAIRLSFPDDRSLPTTIESRSVGDALRFEFPAQPLAAMDVVIEGSTDADQLDEYAVALSRLPHVVAVKLTNANYVNGQRIGERPALTLMAPTSRSSRMSILPAMRPDACLIRYVKHPFQVPCLSADSLQKTLIAKRLC